jgi:hypothetical protein
MLSPELDNSLARVELYFDAVSAAIRSGDPQALHTASLCLKQAAVDFSSLLATGRFEADIASKAVRLRLGNITEGFAMQRENLIRRNASIERALNVIMPASCVATYQPLAGQYGAGGARPSGEFRFIAA